ncbi:hypothetical protein IHV25_07880 [Phaeovibrio sulfidiphilus]|uniref:Methyltransferase n=1 Tax=Phaeovibrio sulfidiphilus TaxID=1220600 RepID=A0A8J6YN59_9PROT|nr:TylF/MycF/NovP-related O-methyltransferase [Phaeovibrio sulfidiphilus]MBE1237565.1 hypothetical protein [Phaeovibrio sulfidiphilus]
MLSTLRGALKDGLSRVPVDFVERWLALSILRNRFPTVRQTPAFPRREDLWRSVFAPLENREITVLEFGVFRGESIRTFSELNTHPQSRFYGFDSFEGLPEDWTRTLPRSSFDVEGQIPQIADPRVQFIKGWFQNTLPDFLSGRSELKNLVVHYDADIYSATVFAMTMIDRFKEPYLAIFDEFTGHETRALWNYCQMTGATVEFSGFAGDARFPMQVACTITPARTYEP